MTVTLTDPSATLAKEPAIVGVTRRWNRPARWSVTIALLARRLLVALRARATARIDESGNVITDNLAWIVFGVIAIVAIGAAISGLGSDVITFVKGQLGVG